MVGVIFFYFLVGEKKSAGGYIVAEFWSFSYIIQKRRDALGQSSGSLDAPHTIFSPRTSSFWVLNSNIKMVTL